MLLFDEFVWIWNRSQGFTTPSLHLRMAKWLGKGGGQDSRELLLLAFRNSGKSTIVGLFCAWKLLRDPNTRILVIAGDFEIAKKMVRNVKQVVERHPATRGLKPVKSDQWAADQFAVRRSASLRDPSVLAKGISSNLTGLRADVIICDDVEVPNTCDTPGKRKALRERLSEVDYILVPGGLKLFVGTPHTQDSIYRREATSTSVPKETFLDGYQRLELPLLDAQGQSRWPERFPLSVIEKLRRRTSPAKFDSQMMLRPRSLQDARLDPEQLITYEEDLHYRETNREAVLSVKGKRLVSATCWWDPSYGNPRKGDASVVAVVFTSEDGYYWLHRIAYLKHDPAKLLEVDAATQLCRQVASFASEMFVPAITIETNGLGRFLPGLLRLELERKRVPCAVLEHVSRVQKDLRIIDAFEAILAGQRLFVHSSVLETPFLTEIKEWQPGMSAPDDGLDAVAGCIASEPVRLPKFFGNNGVTSSRGRNWRPSNTVIEVNTEFLV